MYEEGSLVLYRSNGICTVKAIRQLPAGGRDDLYYILSPLCEPSDTVCVPVHNTQLSHLIEPVVARDEIIEIISKLPGSVFVYPEEPRARARFFDGILDSGDRLKILTLITGLLERREYMFSHGKKPRSVDEAALKKAQSIICTEFSIVLDIPPEQVFEFIRTTLSLMNATPGA